MSFSLIRHCGGVGADTRPIEPSFRLIGDGVVVGRPVDMLERAHAIGIDVL